MYRYVYLVLLMLLIGTAVHAQSKRIFLNDNGEKTSEAEATSYLDVKKMPPDSGYTDSGFVMHQYNMDNSIMCSGTYKDSALAIPNGKFIYYYAYPIIKSKKEKTAPKDTFKFIKASGIYIDGKEDGTWRYYTLDGKLTSVRTFKKGILNGPYIEYARWGQVITGNYVNGFKDGEWHRTSIYGKIVETQKFNNGELQDPEPVDANATMVRAYAKYDFEDYIRHKLARYIEYNTNGTMVFTFLIGADGVLMKPIVLESLSKKLDQAVIDAILIAPKWIPAYYIRPVESQMTITYSISHNSTNAVFQYGRDYSNVGRVPLIH